MIVSKLAAAALVVSVAAAPLPEERETAARQLSMHRKNVVVQPYQRRATDCIVRAVAADGRFKDGPADGPSNALGDLIVELMPQCAGPMRAMIEAYDRNFGAGAGEAFFMGPYLDLLPRTIGERAAGISR
ncbi:MAG: hypothetical protein FJX62_22055 [Alphaproteobacteria bacterium]|nr:hypothetical protein [Alphaproteobacteria bacterium]